MRRLTPHGIISLSVKNEIQTHLFCLGATILALFIISEVLRL